MINASFESPDRRGFNGATLIERRRRIDKDIREIPVFLRITHEICWNRLLKTLATTRKLGIYDEGSKIVDISSIQCRVHINIILEESSWWRE
jgi:hypothetical protein